MSLDSSVRFSRPRRTYDGEGTQETLDNNWQKLYCDPKVNGNDLTILVNADEDIRIGDVVEIPHNLFLKGA